MQATADSLSMCNNHTPLEVSEAKHLQWIDSILGIKGTTLIDYRNGIYQYNDTRFYWNRTFDYFLVYPSSFTHGKESDLGDGNPVSYTHLVIFLLFMLWDIRMLYQYIV